MRSKNHCAANAETPPCVSSGAPGPESDHPGFDASRAIGVTLVILVSLGSVTCTNMFPRENWSHKWGQLVPHQTFPGDCGICHIPSDWQTLRDDFSFDHQAVTGYQLNGAHVRASCLRCHNDRGPVEVYMQRGCGGCHPDPHQSTLGKDCEKCHVESHWEPTPLISDHASTRFPLVGAHALLPCESCHPRATAGVFVNAQVECHFCHQRDAFRASPNHQINGWITNCEDCHTPSSWRSPNFDHSFFALVGGHSGLQCGQCHPGDLFVPIPNDCFSCHQNDYAGAPNHVAGGLSTDCTDCHTIIAWR